MNWFDHPSMQQWARHIRDDVAEKIKDSYATCSIVPSDGEPDVKFAVELGLSIMYDKPILLVVPPGTKLPDHLVRVADSIVEGHPDQEETAARIKAALDGL